VYWRILFSIYSSNSNVAAVAYFACENLGLGHGCVVFVYWHQCMIAMAKAAFNKKRILFTSTLGLELSKKILKCYVWSIALYGAETWTFRAVDQKHLEIFKMWCWRRMEKISWTDHVRNEEVLLRAKEQRNIVHEIRKRKAKWIGHILRTNCLLQRVIEGKIQGGIEVTGRQGRRRRTILREGEDTFI